MVYRAIKAFRDGAAHISFIKNMNPTFLTQKRNQEDTSQDYYRYAPFPYLSNKKGKKYSYKDLKKIHEFVKITIPSDVRSIISDIPSHRIKYEFYHVERGPFIDLLHTKMIELLKEVNVW